MRGPVAQVSRWFPVRSSGEGLPVVPGEVVLPVRSPGEVGLPVSLAPGESLPVRWSTFPVRFPVQAFMARFIPVFRVFFVVRVNRVEPWVPPVVAVREALSAAMWSEWTFERCS